MKEYIVIELQNNNRYAVIDILELQNKKYFLLTKLLANNYNIDSNFEICIYNELTNNFFQIENEFEYNNIKTIFEKKLEVQRKYLESLKNINIPNMIKLKVININGYNYTLQKSNGEIINMNIEIYGSQKIEINNYIYVEERILEEKNLFQYGPIINNKNEIIKVSGENKEYYLQRYYG